MKSKSLSRLFQGLFLILSMTEVLCSRSILKLERERQGRDGSVGGGGGKGRLGERENGEVETDRSVKRRASLGERMQ